MIKRLILRWLGVMDHDARLNDLERHFVTRRAPDGKVVETLADIPMRDRKERREKMKGLTWNQRKTLLEETDGGRYARKTGSNG